MTTTTSTTGISTGRPAPDRSSRVSLATLLQRSYRDNADAAAVIDGGVATTFAAHGRRVRQAVNVFTELGIRPGEPVAFVASNRREFLELDHACVVGGFVRTAEVPRLHPQEIAQVLTDCAARIVVVESEWWPQLESVRDHIPTVEHLVVLGDTAPAGVLAWEPLLAAATDAEPAHAPAPGDDGWILYTSGTTGKPKGVTLTHANLVSMVRNFLAELPPLGPQDVIAHTAPLGHMSGAIGLTGLVRGAAQLTLPRFDPHELLRTVQDHRVSMIVVVPTMLNLLTDAAREGDYDLSSLRTIVYGASTIAPDRLSRAIEVFGDVFLQIYGQSEVVIPVTVLPPADHRARADGSFPPKLASAGRPTPTVELRIVDADRREVAAGEAGEVSVRSDMLMRGYWNQPDTTAEVIDDEGWLYTGDIGRLDDEGYLYIVDRKKDMIISGGFNIYPSEVEAVISALPQVLEVAVVGAPHERWGEQITAVVVRRGGAELSAGDVETACRAALAGYKVPRRIEFHDSLPKNERGKILRRALRDTFWADRERQV